jgi:hypothetical protein
MTDERQSAQAMSRLKIEATVPRDPITHPCPGDRYDWNGKTVDVCASAPLLVNGYSLPIAVYVDRDFEIWMKSPWLKMHKTAKLIRTAEQFMEQIEASPTGKLSVLD